MLTCQSGETQSQRMRPVISMRRVSELKHHAKPIKIHEMRDLDFICASIREFGFVKPLLIDGEGAIVDGELRLRAAKRLGMEEVPAIDVGALDEPSRRALAIAINNHAGKFDEGRLSDELAVLRGMSLDAIGFTQDEIERLIAENPRLKEERKQLQPIEMTYVLIGVPVAMRTSLHEIVRQAESLGADILYSGK